MKICHTTKTKRAKKRQPSTLISTLTIMKTNVEKRLKAKDKTTKQQSDRHGLRVLLTTSFEPRNTAETKTGCNLLENAPYMMQKI
ncbi:hypothetical protein [Hallella colorans]|uniref:hypothetical protein n=1 Tax=Hallella colorans TaxID=1703337 RepID=UPI0023F17937|nr:hypothetical protein [Hallella colorans]